MRRSWMKIRCQPLELTKNPRYRKSWYWLKTVRLRNAAYKTIFWKCNVSSRGRFLVVTFVSLPSRIVFLFQMRGELNMRKEEGKMEISGVLRNLIWSMWTHTHTLLRKIWSPAYTKSEPQFQKHGYIYFVYFLTLLLVFVIFCLSVSVFLVFSHF